MRNWPSVDFVPQAMSGLMDLNGQPGDPPTKYGVEMADYAGGIFGALSICGALYKRSVTGQGEYIDLGMHDTMTFQLNYHAIRYQYAGLEYGAHRQPDRRQRHLRRLSVQGRPRGNCQRRRHTVEGVRRDAGPA